MKDKYISSITKNKKGQLETVLYNLGQQEIVVFGQQTLRNDSYMQIIFHIKS